MAPRSPLEFADLFRGLDTADRAAFVAAVWRARGWEATVADSTVVARDGERTRRILVIRPGWFRVPSLSGVDVVVVTRDRDAVRDAAAEAGVEYVTPQALHDLLCYGIDRDVAATIFSEHFGRSLDAPRRSASTTTSDRSFSVPGTPPSTTAVLVAVCVVIAGLVVADPSFLSFGGPSNAAVAVTGTFTPGEDGALGGDVESTAEPSPYPEGLDENGVTNATLLSDVHLQKTLNHRYAFSFDFDGPPAAPGFDDWESIEWELVVEHQRAFLVDAEFNGTDDHWRTVNIYANGVTDYRIYRSPNGSRTSEAPTAASDADSYAYFAKRLVETYLNTTESSVDCVSETDDGCIRYRVVATGNAPDVSSELPEETTISNYQAVALVTDDGFVTGFSVSYDLVHDGFPETVSFNFSYDDYGSARISRPAWVSKIRTDDARHPTDTPGNATESSPTESTPAATSTP